MAQFEMLSIALIGDERQARFRGKITVSWVGRSTHVSHQVFWPIAARPNNTRQTGMPRRVDASPRARVRVRIETS